MMIGILSGVAALLLAWMVTRRALHRKLLPRPCAKVPVSAAMSRRFHAVRSADSLGEAARWSVETGHCLPIVDDGAAVGVLTRHDIADGLTHAGEDAPVGRVPHHPAVTVTPDAPVDDVVARLARVPDGIAVVVDGVRPVGIVTAEQLATFIALHGDRPEVR